MRLKLEAWKSVAFSRRVRFSSCFLRAAGFIFVFLLLHMGWQTVGTQEMLECLFYCRVGRNFQEKKSGVAVSQKTMCLISRLGRCGHSIDSRFIDRPTFCLVGIQMTGNWYFPSFFCCFLPSSNCSLCHPRKKGRGSLTWWHGCLL